MWYHVKCLEYDTSVRQHYKSEHWAPCCNQTPPWYKKIVESDIKPDQTNKQYFVKYPGMLYAVCFSIRYTLIWHASDFSNLHVPIACHLVRALGGMLIPQLLYRIYSNKCPLSNKHPLPFPEKWKGTRKWNGPGMFIRAEGVFIRKL